jgi:hypothetical protein
MISHFSDDRPERDDIGSMIDEWSMSDCPICKHPWTEHPANYWEGCNHMNDDGPCGCPGEF